MSPAEISKKYSQEAIATALKILESENGSKKNKKNSV